MHIGVEDLSGRIRIDDVQNAATRADETQALEAQPPWPIPPGRLCRGRSRRRPGSLRAGVDVFIRRRPPWGQDAGVALTTVGADEVGGGLTGLGFGLLQLVEDDPLDVAHALGGTELLVDDLTGPLEGDDLGGGDAERLDALGDGGLG